MPQKHGPGCNCCAPCGFGCDPCLGSVEIDAGACGGATFSYPLPDPCTGIVTLSDPFCSTSDCVLDECVESVKELIYDTEAYCNEECQAGFGTYSCPGQWQARWVRDYEHLKVWVNKIVRKSYSYVITFTGDKTMTIDVVCTTYFFAYISYYYTWRREQSALGSCWATYAEACAETPTSWATTQETEEGGACGVSESGPDIQCCNPSCEGPAPPGPILCRGASTVLAPCADGESCYYILNAKCEATYSGEFTLATCDDFLATFTLDRTNDSCGIADVDVAWAWSRRAKGGIFDPPIRPLCISVLCTDITGCEVDDCWPATIDVTLA